MTRIIITGANSFVGKNYIRFSENKDIKEVSLFEHQPEKISFAGYDVVINLVAIVHQSRQISEDEYMKVNRDLCIRVARKAKQDGVSHFIFLSTIKVYGKFIPGSSAWNENSECFPDDSYGKSKYEAEQHLMEMTDKDFIVSIIRTPLVYGEGVKANMHSIMKLIKRFHILPFKGIENKRCFTSAENLSAFIDRIIDKKISGIFIAMDEKAMSTTELVKLISNGMGKKVSLFRIPHFIVRVGMILAPKIFERLFGSFEIDNSKTLEILDLYPPYSTEECINRMAKTEFIDNKEVRRAIR